MIRFHFMNNKGLDEKILAICESENCNGMSMLMNHVCFSDLREFLLFINNYCQRDEQFRTIKKCKVNRKVSIPDAVYHGLKLCHKELDTFSIALIWRSVLIDFVECYNAGGLNAWEDFKRDVIGNGQIREKRQRKDNKVLLKEISSVHITGNTWQNISKIAFYTLGNQFIGYIRC